MKNACLLLLLCVAGFCVTAGAEENKPLSAFPPSDFHFSGTWDCSGTFRSNAVHKSIFSGASIVADKWLELAEQDVQPATGYTAKYLIGYDSAAKHLVEFDANNFGAAVYTSDEGWRNNVLTMTSGISQDPKASYAANRFLYSITGADSFTVEWQISKTADLNWQRGDFLACKRRS
jgi:hypothetical protein